MSKDKAKSGTTTVKLADFVERKMAGAINIETDDGQLFTIPPPELWPDKAMDLALAKDVTGMAAAILGPEEYEQFVEAGGSATIVNAIFAEHHGKGAASNLGA